MSKEISLNNKYRVLLTEVLPYELPLMLDNEGIYLNIQDKDLCKTFNISTISVLKTIQYAQKWPHRNLRWG